MRKCVSSTSDQDISKKLILYIILVNFLTKKFDLVALGGTFDHLHLGHKSLLSKAFELGNDVIIGVTSDCYFKKYRTKSKLIQSYDHRVSNLMNFINKNFQNISFSIIKLDDKFGPTIISDKIQALVASGETKNIGAQINRIRMQKGLKPLEIFVVDLILSSDGIPISSTRIRAGEINIEGKILKKNHKVYKY